MSPEGYISSVIEVREYITEDGDSPYDDWLSGLDRKSRARVRVRVDRVSLGNFGDHKRLTEELYELRLFFGPGYRVYIAREGTTVVILLCGGDKSTQKMDIKSAAALWADYQSTEE